MANRNRRLALTAIALTFMFVARPGSARAATIMVTTLADTLASGACSLRQAITNANGQNQSGSTNCTAGSGNNDTIEFNVTGTIALGSTLPTIVAGETLTIIGPTNAPGIIIDGVGTVQLMQVNSGATLNLQLLTLENGSVTGASGSVGMVGEGGGIFNSGTLTITNSTLSGNHATGGRSTAVSAVGGDGVGGGIFNSGTLTSPAARFQPTRPLAAASAASAAPPAAATAAPSATMAQRPSPTARFRATRPPPAAAPSAAPFSTCTLPAPCSPSPTAPSRAIRPTAVPAAPSTTIVASPVS